MFAQQVAAAQPLLIGLLLLWTSYGKLADPEEADKTALPKLVGENRAKPVYRAVGVIEAVLALALLSPPAWTAEVLAATTLGLGFTGYLVYAKVVVPEASCGCAGKSAKPVGYRSIARALLLTATAAIALTADPRMVVGRTGRGRPDRRSGRVRGTVARARPLLAPAPSTAARPAQPPTRWYGEQRHTARRYPAPPAPQPRLSRGDRTAQVRHP